jgi:hypothetical protein
MNGYERVALLSLIILIISIINETNNPFIDSKPSVIDYIHIYIIRYIHYIIYLFSSFYLIFFNGVGRNIDMYIYLTLIFFIVLGWYIFESCSLSYTELLFYNIDLEKVETTFHPTFYSIYNNYTKYFMLISGIFYIITVGTILYSLNSVQFIYKIIYGIIFLFLFIDSIIKGRINTLYYSTKNNQLLFLKKLQGLYRTYIK